MMNITSILTLVVTVFGACINFQLKCPDSSHRNLRSQIICNGTSTSKYYCLFDENRGRFVEQCKEEPDHVRPGERYVITGRRRNVDCSSEKMQPFLFWTNASSDCVFVKSNCHEPGQMLYDNGTTKMDRSCRCDYTRGFDFIVKPTHLCYCIPSIEDCSCYQTVCAVTRKLTPDYECVTKDHDTFYSVCPLIIHNRLRTVHPTIHSITSYEERRPGFIYKMLSSRKQSDPTLLSTEQLQLENKTQNKLNMVTEQLEEIKKDYVSPIVNRIEHTKNVVFRAVKDSESLFVKTRAYHEMLKVLKDKHYVVIKGNPGDGKTTLAFFALNTLITKKGMKPLQLFKYTEWDDYVSPNAKNLVIFIDNLFGEFSVSDEAVTEWRNRFPQLKANVSESMNLIIVIRNDIYNHCKRSSTCDFLDPAMVDISHSKEFQLSFIEMEKIFSKYMPDSAYSLYGLQDIGPKLGFPQCCRLFRETPSLKEKGLSFFENPLWFLKNELHERFKSNDMQMAVLVCVLLYGGKIDKDTLYNYRADNPRMTIAMSICSISSNDVNALKKFRESISTIEASFIVRDTNDDTITFAHSSIQSATFLVVGEYKKDDLIKYCDYTLLSMITTSQSVNTDMESIRIPNTCFRILSERIRELLLDPLFTDLNVISELPVWNDDSFVNECHYFDDLILGAVDKDDHSLFVHFSTVGCLKWVEYLYDKIVDPKQLIFALEEACGANKDKIVTFLLEKQVQPNIKCCFNAVRAWSPNNFKVINALADAKDDLTELCETQSHWKKVPILTTVLGEAAMLNQCGLIEPLLELCPKLASIKSSHGTTFVHLLARAGNVEILKTYIAREPCSAYDKSGFNSTILHFACQNNRWETVKYIVKTYPDLLLPKNYCFVSGTVLHTAAQSGNIKLFDYVHLETKAKLEKEKITSIQLDNQCFVYAADRTKQTCIEISQLLQVRDEQNRSIFHQAAWSRSIELCKYIASIDDIGLDFVMEIDSILDHANSRDDNADMILFLKRTYGVSQTECQSLPGTCRS